MQNFEHYLKVILQGASLVLIVIFTILVAVFILTSILYIPVRKAIKNNLKASESYEIEQRIYLDEYKYVVENESLRNKLEAKEQELKEIQSNIRKKAAELKSLDAEMEKKKGKKKD